MSAPFPDAARIAATVLALVERAGGKTVDPTEVARALAGSDEKVWSRLMPAIRRVSLGLAREGRISIYRKGKPLDPDGLKGIYRLGPPVP